MSNWFEAIDVYANAVDERRFARSEIEAEREAQAIRELYRARGVGWAIFIVPHDCDPDAGADRSCLSRLSLHAPRCSHNAIKLAHEAGLL